MKKTICILLALVMILSLAACGSKKAEAPAAAPAATEAPKAEAPAEQPAEQPAEPEKPASTTLVIYSPTPTPKWRA